MVIYKILELPPIVLEVIALFIDYVSSHRDEINYFVELIIEESKRSLSYGEYRGIDEIIINEFSYNGDKEILYKIFHNKSRDYQLYKTLIELFVNDKSLKEDLNRYYKVMDIRGNLIFINVV